MTLEEFLALPQAKQAEIREETALRIAEDMDIDALIEAQTDRLIYIYREEPAACLEDAHIWGVIDED